MGEAAAEAGEIKNIVLCLTCRKPISPVRLKALGEFSLSILEEVFDTLSIYMKWEDTDCCRKFDFSKEIFPFCEACRSTAIAVHCLNKQVKKLLEQIDQLTATLSANIIFSKKNDAGIDLTAKEEKYETDTAVNSPVLAYDLDKISSYRSLTYKRFNVSVSLSPLKPSEYVQHNNRQLKKRRRRPDKVAGKAKMKSENTKVNLVVPKAINEEVNDNNLKSVAQNLDEITHGESFLNESEFMDYGEDFEADRDLDDNPSKITSSSDDEQSDYEGINKGNPDSENNNSRRRSRKDKPLKFIRLGDRVQIVDEDHFIFDETYPFERVDNRWKCGSCDASYDKQLLIEKHLLCTCKISAIGRYKVVVVSETSFDYAGVIFEKLENAFKCTHCPHVSKSEKQATDHIRHCHIYEPVRRKFNQNVKEIEANCFQYGEKYQYVFQDGIFKCRTCGSEHRKVTSMVGHIEEVHCREDRRNATNDVRTKSSQNVTRLKARWRTFAEQLVPNGPNMYLYCNSIEVEQLAERSYKCLKCSKTYDRRFILEHLHFHQKQIAKSHMCDTCGKTFAQRSQLQEHTARVHPETIDHRHPIICEYCGKSFLRPNELDRHLPVHTHVIHKPVTCEICNKVLSKFRLKRHLLGHTKPQFKCHLCPKSFAELRLQQRHIKVVHENAKPYSCDECGKEFGHQTSIAYHKRRFHSEISAELNMKKKTRAKPGNEKYFCDLCGKGIYRKDSMKYHKIRYHSELTADLDRQLKEKLCRKKSRKRDNEHTTIS